jgi:hypothetical protein
MAYHPCRGGQREAKIMTAKKMEMAITGTTHSAMVLTPVGRLQRLHDYKGKGRANFPELSWFDLIETERNSRMAIAPF